MRNSPFTPIVHIVRMVLGYRSARPSLRTRSRRAWRLLPRLMPALPMLMLAACQPADEPGPQQGAAPAAATQSTAPASLDRNTAIEAALSHSERLPGDREQDRWRRADEVLRFMALQPGMRVIDYLAGGGYYTELLARVVGPEGEVIAYNNATYLKYAGEQPEQRYGNARLPNVRQLTTAPAALSLEPASLDAALFVQSYHDLHWQSKEGSWPRTDPVQALAALVPALKPDAVVVVVDHVAAAGSDPAVTVDRLHRIDPAVIRKDFEAAGLIFDAESPVFRQPEDDHTRSVFDESVRHRTDQVMYRFRKP